jgi:hypothetical protein
LSVAGEWTGWQEDWLVARILERMQHRPPFLIGKRRFMPDEWPEIEAALAASADYP